MLLKVGYFDTLRAMMTRHNSSIQVVQGSVPTGDRAETATGGS